VPGWLLTFSIHSTTAGSSHGERARRADHVRKSYFVALALALVLTSTVARRKRQE
jgi:hypothetical protein